MTSNDGVYRIQVPSTNLAGGGSDMRSRLQTWDWRYRLPEWVTALEIDFSQNNFIEPWALAQFTAYGLNVKERLRIPVSATLASRNPANVYVGQMGLNHVLATGTSTPEWDNSSQNTGLHVIRNHQDVIRFVQSAVQLGAGPNDDTMDALKYGMAELGRNVVQHSGSSIGGVAIAQYFPARNALQISVCDAGRGVHSSLSRTYPELKTDLEALKLAVLPHVSGAFQQGVYSGSENAGLGLFFGKEICWRAGGSFWLASQRALLGVTQKDDAGQNRVYRQIEQFNGTSVTMDLPASGVEDFGSLLQVCRTLAADARASSGCAGLDFLDKLPDLDDLAIVSVETFSEDVEQAAVVRSQQILPALQAGEMIVMDFNGVRFATQSFIHALLNDAFRVPGSLCRLSFINCSASTEEAVRAVAAYAASYRQCIG
jgi:hypothetical protein